MQTNDGGDAVILLNTHAMLGNLLHRILAGQQSNQQKVTYISDHG